ncbi:chymotrypsin-like elastase family member 2A [Pholidichthys leucotaenia]
MKFVILALFVTGAYGCGVPTFPPNVNRGVCGEDVVKNSWPWQASLQYRSGSNFYHTCGATLISQEWVITAAHCISSRTYRVYLGKHSMDTTNEPGSIAISPAKILLHPYWDSYNMRNDIALIKLSTPVTLTDQIKLACLPNNGEILDHNFPCYVTGWGRPLTGGPFAIILQQVLLLVVDYPTCSRNDWWGSLVTTDMICAGGDGNLACCIAQHHANIQLLFVGKLWRSPDGSWSVHGVMRFSSSVGCNYYKKPSVFTRVSAYIDWINMEIARN